MRISELLKAEQTGFISLAELLITLSKNDDGCEISVAAQFLRLKLNTAPNGTRPNWEKVRWSLTGPEIVQSRSKHSNEVISLLENLCTADCDAVFSDDKFLRAYFYGFDRAEITTFFASCGVNIEFNNSDVLDQSERPSSAAKADSEKPLATTERNTLLTIIAVLAKAAKINIDPPGKAAAFISGLTDEFGAHVSKRAIEEHLKKIPNALETRMK